MKITHLQIATNTFIMKLLIISFKIIKSIIRKCSFFIGTAHIKVICFLNGVKHGKIRSIGSPYINISRFGTAEIGNNFYLRTGQSNSEVGQIGTRIIVRGKGKLKIGANVGMTNATIFADNSITIGDNVMIGGGTQIFDTNFHSTDPVIRTSGKEISEDVKTAPVMIGNNVFIGTNCIICKGVIIEDNAIIPAGSVVYKQKQGAL